MSIADTRLSLKVHAPLFPGRPERWAIDSDRETEPELPKNIGTCGSTSRFNADWHSWHVDDDPMADDKIGYEGQVPETVFSPWCSLKFDSVQAEGSPQSISERQCLSHWNKLLENCHHFRGRAHCIRSQFRRGVLRLSGVLPTWYLKQLLQNLAAHCPGVQRVVNRVEVFEPSLPSSSRAAMERNGCVRAS